MEGYLTLTEAAQRLGLVDSSPLRHLIAAGKLRAERAGPVWLVRPEDVDAIAGQIRPRGPRGQYRPRTEPPRAEEGAT